jgi:hypothetical protein
VVVADLWDGDKPDQTCHSRALGRLPFHDGIKPIGEVPMSGKQFGLLATAPSTSTTLVGLTVRLDRDTDRDRPCCENRAIVGSTKGMHHASLTCANCGSFRGWLSAEAADFITGTRAKFGAPQTIVLRNSRALPGASDEEQIHSATGDNPPMKRDEIFPSKYLKASDLNKPIVVTIDSAPLELLKNPEGREQNKTVLYFKGAKKALPLNVSNWDAVAAICGEDTDDWPGGKIELYAAKTHMGGKMVDCIRVRAPRDVTPPKAEPPEVSELDDSIPF